MHSPARGEQGAHPALLMDHWTPNLGSIPAHTGAFCSYLSLAQCLNYLLEGPVLWPSNSQGIKLKYFLHVGDCSLCGEIKMQKKNLNIVKVCMEIPEITLPRWAGDNAVLTQKSQMYFAVYKSSLMYPTFNYWYVQHVWISMLVTLKSNKFRCKNTGRDWLVDDFFFLQ